MENFQTQLSEEILEPIRLALKEDIGPGDATTDAIVPSGARMKGQILAKQDGVVAGLDVAQAAYWLFDPEVSMTVQVAEGARLQRGQVLALLSGRARSLLTV